MPSPEGDFGPGLFENPGPRLFEPGATAIITLGASAWRIPSLAGGLPFTNASSAFRDHLLGDAALRIDLRRDVLDLFDDPRNQTEHVEQIAAFLERRTDAARDGGPPGPGSVILHYVGHGVFTADRRFAVLLRSSTNRDATKLRMADMADTLRASAPGARLAVILDCCYSGEAAQDFMSDTGEAAFSGVRGGLVRAHEHLSEPPRGTIVYCSSSRFDVSSAGKGADLTMFTGALLAALRTGMVGGSEFLSFRELHRETLRAIRARFGDTGVIPQLQETEQFGDELLDLPAFPNRANPFVVSDGGRAAADLPANSPGREPPAGTQSKRWREPGLKWRLAAVGLTLATAVAGGLWFIGGVPVHPPSPEPNASSPPRIPDRPADVATSVPAPALVMTSFGKLPPRIKQTATGLPVTTIEFNDLPDETGTKFTRYSEAGIQIEALSGDWLIASLKADQTPFRYLYFEEHAPAVFSEAGIIGISNHGKPFNFISIAIYSSMTRVEYAFVGTKGFDRVFYNKGTVPNTLGKFATIENVSSDVSIDKLELRLSSEPAMLNRLNGGTNPIGINSIAIVDRERPKD